MKTAAKMKAEGFTEISTVECLLRELQVRKITQTVFDPARQPTPNSAADPNRIVESVDELSTKKRKVDEIDNEDDEAETSSKPKVEEMQKSFVTAVPLLKMPGHTGFLTFATLPPDPKYED